MSLYGVLLLRSVKSLRIVCTTVLTHLKNTCSIKILKYLCLTKNQRWTKVTSSNTVDIFVSSCVMTFPYCRFVLRDGQLWLGHAQAILVSNYFDCGIL